MAVEADEIIAAIAEAVEQERRSKIAESRQSETSQLIDQSKNHNDSKAAHAKAAELFNTNRTYINDAKKLRESSPEHFEKIKSGSATLTQVKREMKEQAREARREENRAKVAVEAEEIIAAIAEAVEQERRSKIAESRQSETSQLIDQSKNHNDSKDRPQSRRTVPHQPQLHQRRGKTEDRAA